MKFLTEHYINIWNNNIEDKQKYIDEVWNIIEEAYDYLNGPLKSRDVIMSDSYFWKLVKKNNKVVAVAIYKANDKVKRKLCLCGAVRGFGRELMNILKDDINFSDRSSWMELSGKPEYKLINDGYSPLPDYIAIKVLKNVGKEATPIGDGFHYSRRISGEQHVKAMFGNPPETLSKDSNKLDESLKKATPYMLRNDGELFECPLLHPYIKVQYEHDTDQAIDYLINNDNYSYSVQWFYDHTNSNSLKEEIKSLVRSLEKINKLGKLKDNIEFDYSKANYSTNPEDIRPLFEEINDATNQEFCRVRTSSLKYGGGTGDIYFRISSVGFNWFDIIWELVIKNRNFIESITICKDNQTFGGRISWYKINGMDIYRIPTEEFISLPGKPVIEDLEFKSELNNYSYKELCKGNNLLEVYTNLHPRYVVMNYNTLKEKYINNFNNRSLLENKEDYSGQYTFDGYAYFDKQYSKVVDEFHLETLANSDKEAKRNFIKQIHDKTGYYTYIKEEDINLFSVNPKEYKLLEKVEPEDFNYNTYVNDIFKFIESRGVDLKPYPEIEFNNNDQSKIMIETGNYIPESNKVIIYTNNRHPKDVLRSLFHELIHHNQNIIGRVNDINYKKDIKDKKILGLEAEAYEKGNLLFREWSNTLHESLKEDLSSDIIKELETKENWIKDYPVNGSAFILPSGKYLDCNGYDHHSWIRLELEPLLRKKNLDIEKAVDEIFTDIIRINNDFSEHLLYVVINSEPTSSQYDSLDRWLWNDPKKFINNPFIIYIEPDNHGKTLRLMIDDYDKLDDIIPIIKRYYRTGELSESLREEINHDKIVRDYLNRR